jgi:ribonuclease R
VDPYKRSSSGKQARRKSGIHLGLGAGNVGRTGLKSDGDNLVGELAEQTEVEAKKGQYRFDFGSGRGGYGRHSIGGLSGGGKKGRKSTSESGIFTGEPAARVRKGQAASKKHKANSQTAKFVRKKR